MPPFAVNLAALVAAEAAVRDRAAIRRYVAGIRRSREWFAGELRKLGVKTFASAGNFLLANFGLHGPQLFQRLEHEEILVRERTHDLGPGFVRITIGTPAEMKLLLRKIKQLGFTADRRQ
jgi:histidinol-phosphate aminotransferase